MKIKLICCDVFARLAYQAAAISPHIVDLQLLPMLAHNEPDQLRRDLQTAINNAAEAGGYDKIILAYGLCGNAAAGLSSPVPMIIPRMHDCSAMFLGSRKQFSKVFGHRLSTRWRSCGYMERCPDHQEGYKFDPDYLKMVEEYGEENAEYVWHTLNPPPESSEAVYIELDGYEYGETKPQFLKQMSEADCQTEVVAGDTSWFMRLVNGPWDTADFLELLPGDVIEPIYDMEEIFRGANI
ncbi:MAG: DUF1638 domain-containing protein [Defluviitaleaceae bacterium]|nr:DUF1638 domain-containing protein [Defluviitaleaceae bacterium]